MASGILFNVAEGMLGKLVNLAGQGIGLFLGVEGELEKLKETVSTIKGVLLDAEEQQAQNQTVRNWLEKLKDVVDEADDLVDDFSTEALRREVMDQNRMPKKVRIFEPSQLAPSLLAYRFNSAREIKAIRERLDAIAADRAPFNFDVRPLETQVHYRVPTDSSVIEEEVIGRENDKEAIIQLLLRDNVEKNVSILPIVGIGGLGKTTLAQLVFKDEKIKAKFEKLMWVCVSNSFEVKVVVENIIESITKNKPAENLEIETLANDLREKIDGKKYLLVLDDVWNEDEEKWKRLRAILNGGAKGSRILLTTRIPKVAKMTKTIESYPLSILDDDKAWALFKQKAFEKGQEPENSKFVEIGKEIIKKCAGVPLVISTIGRVLYYKETEREWLALKDREISKIPQNKNDILPTLKLSYDHLPSHLKPCFAFCRLFPKDYKIDIPTLINLWMAQGFINSSNDKQRLEDVGLDYFMDLFWRSFFQEVEKDECGNVNKCKMHDLMHDLAIEVAGKESIILDSNAENIDEKTRHVSFGFNLNPSSQIPTPLFKASRMRTFLLPHQPLSYALEGPIMDKSTFEDIVSSFGFLRVLDMVNTKISIVPDSINKLKHLRYLDLSHNYYIETLPNSISELLNLQTLRLAYCCELKALPKDIYKLVNLKCLKINSCALTYMPHGMGQLTNLQTLSQFVVAANKDNSESGLKELYGLNNLRGRLQITNLRRGEDVAIESKFANLKEKVHLQALSLQSPWCKDVSNKEVGYDEMYLEGFEPHPNLQILSIFRYYGVRFPRWLSSLSNLVDLKLSSCTKCQHWINYSLLSRVSSLTT